MKTKHPTQLTDKLNSTFKIWAKGTSIGDRLRWLLEYREMKQTGLAEKIGVTQAAVSNIVTTSTRKPSAPTLLRMAAVLQASADWIITGNGDPFEISVIGVESEKELIEAFRNMNVQAQSALIAAAKAMSSK